MLVSLNYDRVLIMRDALALLPEELRNVHSIRVYRGSLSAEVLFPETHYSRIP